MTFPSAKLRNGANRLKKRRMVKLGRFGWGCTAQEQLKRLDLQKASEP